MNKNQTNQNQTNLEVEEVVKVPEKKATLENSPNQNSPSENQNQTGKKEVVTITFGPPKVSLLTFGLKLVSAFFGGIAGTLVLIGIFLLSQKFLSPLMSGESIESYISIFFVFIIMIMVFLSTTISNVLSAVLIGVSESEKYKRLSTAVFQIFLVSIIVFIFLVPLYLVTAAINPNYLFLAVALNVLLSVQISALVLEIISNYRHSLVGVYGIALSLPLAAFLLVITSNIFGSNPGILLFASLPIVWVSIAIMNSIVNNIYRFIAITYDKDFLATDTFYSSDYGKDDREVVFEGFEIEENDDSTQGEPQRAEKSGKDFLISNQGSNQDIEK